MKTIIRRSDNATTGYELVEIDGEYEHIRPIDRTYKGEPFTLVLPKNAANRQYFNSKKVDASPDGEVELTLKEPKTTNTTSVKRLVDFATEEEKAIYDELLKTWQERREKSKEKPKMTEKERLERKIEKLKAQIKEMEEEDNEGK